MNYQTIYYIKNLLITLLLFFMVELIFSQSNQENNINQKVNNQITSKKLYEKDKSIDTKVTKKKNSALSHPSSFGLFNLNLFVSGGFSINVDFLKLDDEIQEIHTAFVNFVRSSELDNGSTYFGSPYSLSMDYEGSIQYNIHKFPYFFIRVGFIGSFMIPQNYVLRLKQIDPFATPFEASLSLRGSVLSVPVIFGGEYTIKKASLYAGIGFVYQQASLTVIENGIRTGNTELGDAGEIFVSTTTETKTTFSGAGYGLQFLLGTKVKVWSYLSVFLEMKFTFSGTSVIAIRQEANAQEADIEGATQAFQDAQGDSSTDYVIDRENDTDILNVLNVFPLYPYESRSQSEEAANFLALDTSVIHWRLGVGYAF